MRACGDVEICVHRIAASLIELVAINVDLHADDGVVHGRIAGYVH